jgi:hypothetical protein
MNINGVAMKKLFIYFTVSLVVFSTALSINNTFTKLPTSIDNVLYTYNSSHSSVYLRNNGFSLVAKQLVKEKKPTNFNTSYSDTYEIHRVDFDFLGANTTQIISTNTHTSTFIIEDGITKELLETEEVLYKNIYEGIDFRAYFNKYGDFEFDFIVNTGANPDDIKLVQKYNKSSKIAGNRELEIGIEFGSMMLDAPYSYQGELDNAHLVSSSYYLKGNILSFDLGDYDRAKPLIIDPIARVMGSYFGSNANETAYDIEEDASGNYYMTGYTESPTNIAVGGYQLLHGGLKDAYVVKFDKNDKRIWSTYFGGMNFDIGNRLSIDKQGNIILVGETSSMNNIATPNGHQLIYGGGTADGFVAKFLPNGQLFWATYYGGEIVDKINGVTTDNDGNIYVVGQTNSDDNIYFNGYQSQRDGMYDAFLVKISPLGTIMWATYFGGGADDFGYGIALDNDRNIFIVGSTESDNNIALKANVPTRQGQNDAFVSSFDTDGFIRWGTYYGGSANDIATTITSDGYYIYFGGKTQSYNGIYLSGAQNNLGGGWDGFLVKYDSFQNPFWGTYYGGSGDDAITSIAVRSNSIFTVGSTSSTSKINQLGWQQTYGGGASDGTIAKYLAAGPMEWSSYYGGSGLDELRGVSARNKLYIAGYTNSANNIGIDGFQNTLSGGLDAMFAEMTESELKLFVSEDKYCAKKEYSLSVDFINMNFAANNEFIIEMSDEQGSFDAPIIVGRKTSTSKTDVLIKIPDFSDYSKYYRFRLRSTNPVFVGTVNLDSVTVYPSPRIINSNDPLCVNTIKIFSAQNIKDVNYKWSFEDGIVINGSEIVNNVRWESAGTYKVQLIAENPVCTDTSEKTVIVNEPPTVKVSGNTSVCGSTTEIYTIADTKDYLFTWSAVEGTVIDKNNNGTATIKWNNVSKIGQVILVATDTTSGCSTTKMLEIEINEKPVANLTGADSTCRGCTASVFTQTEGVTKWLVSGGSIVKEYEFQLDYKANNNADSVIISLIKSNENSGCSDTATKVVYMSNSPVVSISGEKEVCEEQKYTYSTKPDTELLNTWSVIGGVTSNETQNSIDVRWGIAGMGKVKLIQQSKDLVYKDSAEISVAISPFPEEINHNLPSSVCTGDTLFVNFDLKEGEEAQIIVTGKIYKEKYIVTQKENFFVEAFVFNSLHCGTSKLIEIEVMPAPPAPILVAGDKIIDSGKEGLHRWYLDGVLLVGQTGKTLTNPTFGVYTAQYKNTSCWSEISEGFVYKTSSVDDALDLDISLYPNPADNLLRVSSNSIIKTLSIVDLLGQSVYTINNISNEELNISELNAGIYFVKILVNDKLLTKKIVVQ